MVAKTSLIIPATATNNEDDNKVMNTKLLGKNDNVEEEKKKKRGWQWSDEDEVGKDDKIKVPEEENRRRW